MKRDVAFWIGAGVVFVLTVVTALAPVNEYFFFAAYVVLSFVVLATAWNILGGYAGYVNFGTAAFFGVGAYTAGTTLFTVKIVCLIVTLRMLSYFRIKHIFINCRYNFCLLVIGI
jgi:branched-chain amino acid transport system permease protein